MNFAEHLFCYFMRLCRKWKEIIDEWVKLKTPGEASTTVMGKTSLYLGKFISFWNENV